MLAFGLASVQFFPFLFDKWTEIYVDLPKVESDSLIFVFPQPPINEYKPLIIPKEMIINDRNMSLYNIGGTFSSYPHRLPEYKRTQKDSIKGRNFIWKHWTEKKRAYIISKWLDEGVSCDSHIFIEPDEKGKWHIIDKTLCNFRAAKPQFTETEIHFIKFKKADELDYEFKSNTLYLALFENEGDEREVKKL